MANQELPVEIERVREEIAQILYDKEFGDEISKNLGGLYPDNLMDLEGKEANQILSIIKEAGYKSPEEINKWLEEQGACHIKTFNVRCSDGQLKDILEPLRLEVKE